jgi:parallel beta-helix repeat protein
MFSDNTVISNIADSGVGGGLYLAGGDAMLSGNTVSGNTANTARRRWAVPGLQYGHT